MIKLVWNAVIMDIIATVPQGGVLGPNISICFINHLLSIIRSGMGMLIDNCINLYSIYNRQSQANEAILAFMHHNMVNILAWEHRW